MTMGTAIVARTNVRTTGDMVASQSPRAKFSAVNVGKTQSQIITALRDFRGYRLVAGSPAEPLLTRSVDRVTGREYWMVTKATLVDDEALMAINVIEDVTDSRRAERRLQLLADVSA